MNSPLQLAAVRSDCAPIILGYSGTPKSDIDLTITQY